MLSVLIETMNDEEKLARTLAALVSGAVQGVVRDVIVCDGGSTDETLRVAEHAGCRVVQGSVAAGVRQAKGDWLLILEAGARPVDGWTEHVVAHVASRSEPARFTRSRDDRAPLWSRLFAQRRVLAEGLLIARALGASRAGEAGSGEAVARGLALVRLPAEIRVAPPRKG